MQEYRVVWQQCPYARHQGRHVLFVNAGSPEAAKTLVRDHVERRHGIEWFTVHEATPVRALPLGDVITKE